MINGTDRIEYPGISRNVKCIHKISTDKKHTRSRERGASLLASLLVTLLTSLLASLFVTVQFQLAFLPLPLNYV